MVTETWFRNPHLYIRECVELGEYWYAWDRALLRYRNIDPTRFVELYLPSHADYRMLVVGDQGTAELRRGHTMRNPVAVYPTWCYDIDHFATLEELMATPAEPTPGLPVDENPVLGQEHRIVLCGAPNASTTPGRRFFRDLRELNADYPDCILHLHGGERWSVMFGFGWESVDVDPRIKALHKTVTLPSGRERKATDLHRSLQWVHLLGYSVIQLQSPRERCMFNMKSAKWAAAFYNDNYRFRTRGPQIIDPDAINPERPIASRLRTVNIPVTVGDRLHCDVCSLNNVCKYFRDGGVCTIPGTETATLAKLFKTKDCDQIIEGLGSMVERMVTRVSDALELEESGDLDPEVTKALNGAFQAGSQLAKLIAPERFSLSKPAPGGGARQVEALDPAALVAEAVRELEAIGVKREDMTPGMFEKVLAPLIARAIPAPAVIDAPGVDVDVV